MARPSKFNQALKEKMIELYRAGKTDAQVANIIGVSVRTINNWKGRHEDFLQSMRESKAIADEMVEASLFAAAAGYSHIEEKIFFNKDTGIVRAKTRKQYPPDTKAGIFWLKNRQPHKWRDKTEVDITSDERKLTDEQIDAKIQEKLKKLSMEGSDAKPVQGSDEAKDESDRDIRGRKGKA